MEQFKYDTYCGQYCGACDIMSTYKKALENHSDCKWEDLPSQLQKNLPRRVKTDEFACYGCKSDVVFKGCTKCTVRKCAKEKMNVESCLECEKYPCITFRIFNFFRWLMKKKLPHVTLIPENQNFIKKNGVSAWLEDQERKWKCPECNTHFTWYMKECKNCGKNLESVKDFRQVRIDT